MPDIPLGPYLLETPIGRGASGVVWRGVHASQGVPVAVKILHEASGDPVQDDALRAEIETVGTLWHPGIVLLLDQGEVPEASARASDGTLRAGQPYLAMELASLGSLAELDRVLEWPELRATLVALLDALAHAHARGVIHRDIKPSNILIAGAADLRPGLKLSDFGIARVGRDRYRKRITGTPRYMAPEQFRGAWRDLGPWTDLYALGCVAWELCTGTSPFGGEDATALAHAHIYDDAPVFSPRAAVPEALESWLRRLLSKEPGHRFRRAADAAFALPPLTARTRPAVAPPPPRPRTVPLTVDTLDDLLATGVAPDPDRTLTDIVNPGPLPEPLEPVAAPPAPAEAPPMPRDWRRPEPPPSLPHLVGAGLGLYSLRQAPLVGRTAEQDLLWETLRSVHERQGLRVVVLRGQAGVGKSALARWLTERVHETGAATPMAALHEPSGGATHGLQATLVEQLGVQQLGHDRAFTRIHRYLQRRGVRDPSEAHAIAELVAPREDEEGTRRSADRRERYAILDRLLMMEGRHRPVLLWLDDAQWGADAIEFTLHLLRRVPDAPSLVLITAQEEALAETDEARDLLERVEQHERTTRVDLDPLKPSSTRKLLQRLLPLREELADQVADRVEGNPLFAVQLLGDWAQRGLLVPNEGGYDLRGDASALLPDDLHDVWSHRIERLLAGPFVGARAVLELAAALGATVNEREWREVVDLSEVELPRGLVAHLVRQRLALPQPTGWRFAHGMFRESVERHAREAGTWSARNLACAAMLEDRPGVDAAARRGRHLAEAGAHDEAVTVLLDAARHHVQRDETRSARAILGLAGEALDQAGVDDADPRRGTWCLLMARVHKSAQDLDRAARLTAQAREAAAAHGWARLEAEARAEQADVARVRGDLRSALEGFRDALRQHEALGDDAGVADTLRSLSNVAIHLGDVAGAERYLDEARTRYEDLGDRVGAALCTAGISDVARSRGDWMATTNNLRSALTVLRNEGHRSGIALCLHGLAEAHRLQGELEEAERGYLEVIRIDRNMGRDASISELNLALCRLQREAWQGALSRLEPLERDWAAQGRPGYLAVVHAAQLPARAGLGQWAAWRRHQQEAERLLGSSGFVDIDVARVLEQAGDVAEASERPGEAARAWALARAQWKALGAEEAVARLDDRLATTVPPVDD